MFLKNKNIFFKNRRSKVTDYAALSIVKKRIESENGQKVDMTRNYHNHILQNSVWHREEESKEKSTNNNSDKTFITPLHRHF